MLLVLNKLLNTNKSNTKSVLLSDRYFPLQKVIILYFNCVILLKDVMSFFTRDTFAKLTIPYCIGKLLVYLLVHAWPA